MEGVRQSVPDISREKLVLQEPEASGVFSHARFKKKKIKKKCSHLSVIIY